jgi:hypothetical protein
MVRRGSKEGRDVAGLGDGGTLGRIAISVGRKVSIIGIFCYATLRSEIMRNNKAGKLPIIKSMEV